MKKIFTKRNIFLFSGSILVLGLISFVESERNRREVKGVLIHLEDEYGNHFIDESDIKKLISSDSYDSIRGKRFPEVDLKELEKRIYKNKFIENAEVYKDHKGNLIIDVVQRRAIARIAQSKGPHAYIGKDGTILPLSPKFTARVLIINGEGSGKLLESAYLNSSEGIKFIDMLHAIDSDPFLKAQVSQLALKGNGEILIYSQVGDEEVEFGKPEDIEEKFKKYKIYYKKILPLKGYNKYKRVNLKFKDQIICE
jgi:cell division protein FtsQ